MARVFSFDSLVVAVLVDRATNADPQIVDVLPSHPCTTKKFRGRRPSFLDPPSATPSKDGCHARIEVSIARGDEPPPSRIVQGFFYKETKISFGGTVDLVLLHQTLYT
jgi:hypothetical protein